MFSHKIEVVNDSIVYAKQKKINYKLYLLGAILLWQDLVGLYHHLEQSK